MLGLHGWYDDDMPVSDCAGEQGAVDDTASPRALAFLPLSPNPSRGPVRLSWVLPQHVDQVDVAIRDLAGRLVRFERLGPHPAGIHGWIWDGRDSGGGPLSVGVYFVRLLAGRDTLYRTLVRLAP